MKQKGFTLVELLVVIAIIGILSTVAIINLQGAKDKAEQANVVAALSQLSSAAIVCHDDGYELDSADTGGNSSACNAEPGQDQPAAAGGDPVCTNSDADWPALATGWIYKPACDSDSAASTWSIGACVGSGVTCASGERYVDCDQTGCTTGFTP